MNDSLTLSQHSCAGISLDYATDHIWTMQDKEGFIGLRIDCGDAGTLYFTKDQAQQVVDQFLLHIEGM